MSIVIFSTNALVYGFLQQLTIIIIVCLDMILFDAEITVVMWMSIFVIVLSILQYHLLQLKNESSSNEDKIEEEDTAAVVDSSCVVKEFVPPNLEFMDTQNPEDLRRCVGIFTPVFS